MILNKCDKNSGIGYDGIVVNWANFQQEYIHVVMQNIIFQGDVEIDESLFGRRCKYHQGNLYFGIKVWIFGIIWR